MSYYKDNHFNVVTNPEEDYESIRIRGVGNFIDHVKESLDNIEHRDGVSNIEVVIFSNADNKVNIETHYAANLETIDPDKEVYGDSYHTSRSYSCQDGSEASRLFYRLNEAFEVHTHSPDDKEHILDIGNGDGYGHSITILTGESSDDDQPNTYSAPEEK